MKELFNFDYPHFLYFKEETYIDEELTAEFSEYLKEKFLENNTFFWEVLDKEEKSCQNLIKFSKDVSMINSRTLDKGELLSVFDNYITNYANCTRFLLLNVLMGSVVEKEIEQILQQKSPSIAAVQKDKIIIFALAKETETAAFNREILKLSINFEEDKIFSILQKFSWLNLEDGFGKPFTVEDIKRMIINADEAKQKLASLEEHSEELKPVEKILKDYQFNEKEQKLYELLQKIIYSRAKINEDLNKSGFNLLNFFQNFAAKFNLTVEELFHLSIHEVKQVIQGNTIPWDLLQERMINHAVIMKNREIAIVSGNDLKNVQFQSEDIPYSNILTGKCAYPGKVKAPVVVVNSLEDLEKVKDGHVLVTKFITPYYVPAMRKASAVITDIGGVTSHGAVLARELGKPCIIGTEKATTFLHDNDIVEIDAERGIIRKI